MRERPAEALIANFTPVTLPTVQLICPAAHLNTPYLRGILLAKAYSSFYPLEEFPVRPMHMAAGLASMLANLLNPDNVERRGELRDSFHKSGFNIVRWEFNTAAEVEGLLLDPQVRAFFDLFDVPDQAQFLAERDEQILCIGILLLTMGKDVNPDNYDGWIANRLKTFQGALGIVPDKSCWTSGQCPPQESLTSCYRFISASFFLRRTLFLIVVSGARHNSRFAAVLKEVLVFLQGVEMGHILMIDRYIFSKYPELLRIRLLRDNMAAMNRAWEFLASLPAGERFFAKILYDKSETAALNRQNFHLLANAAVSAAQFETPSMRFYRGGNVTATSGALADVVNKYLAMRLNLASTSIVQSNYAYMTDHEREMFLAATEGVWFGRLFTADVFSERAVNNGLRP